MRYYVLVLCLLLCLTVPLHAQDNPPQYHRALYLIEKAAASGRVVLDLSSLNLTDLPPEIGQLTDLQELYLYHNQLTSLPPEIGQLTNLRRLGLSDNQLTSLPPEIGQLTNLQRLVLDSNQLTSLPPEIAHLTNLQWLHLNSNELTRFPSEISQLTNLQWLLFNNNQLTGLPPEIGQMINLNRLFIEHNQLRHLPSELGNLTSLTCEDCRLALDDNPLISPPPEVVEQGTVAVLAYLRNQAWYHVQRLIIASASGVGMLAMLLLGVRYRQSQRKSKAKRG